MPASGSTTSSETQSPAISIWNAGRGVNGTPAAIYLASRKITPSGNVEDALRYVSEDGKHMLLGAIRTWNDGQPGPAIAIQRIFLTPTGQGTADHDGQRKKCLGAMADESGKQAFWFMPGVEPAIICEGIEDALAVRKAYFDKAQRTPMVVATLGVGRFKRAAEVFPSAIFVPDNEAAAIKNAEEAARACGGKVVMLGKLELADGCSDANELLQAVGPDAVLKAVAGAVEPPSAPERIFDASKHESPPSGHASRDDGSRLEDVERALNAYWDFDGYEDWTNAAMALHTIQGGKDAWLTWAKRSQKFNAAENERKWRDTVPTRGMTVASILARVPKSVLADWGREHAARSPRHSLDGFDVEDGGGEDGNDNAAKPQKPKAATFKLMPFASFVASLQPPDYLVDNIIQRGWLYALTAMTGAGKTAVALELAMRVATGKPLGALETSQGRVVYLSGENPEDVKARCLMLAHHHAMADPDIFFLEGAIKLEEHIDRLISQIEEIGGAAFVVVDTSASYFGGEDDNSNVELGEYARLFRRICKMPCQPTVLVLAHPIKNPSKSNLLPRGGGAFLNEVDGNLTLWTEDKEITTLHWQGKFRGPEFEPMQFRLKLVKHPNFRDAKGREMPSVIALPVDFTQAEKIEEENLKQEDRVLLSFDTHPDLSVRDRARLLGMLLETGAPAKSKLDRILSKLVEGKMLEQKRNKRHQLTNRGRTEINQITGHTWTGAKPEEGGQPDARSGGEPSACTAKRNPKKTSKKGAK